MGEIPPDFKSKQARGMLRLGNHCRNEDMDAIPRDLSSQAGGVLHLAEDCRV